MHTDLECGRAHAEDGRCVNQPQTQKQQQQPPPAHATTQTHATTQQPTHVEVDGGQVCPEADGECAEAGLQEVHAHGHARAGDDDPGGVFWGWG